MKDLQQFLKGKKYKKIKFKVSKTQHLLVKAKVNGIQGDFILDTGASNSCVSFENIDYFQLTANHSKTKAAGAGATGMETKLSENNILKLGHWTDKNFSIVIFDLSHVNLALEQYKAKPVHGIIGADTLLKGKAIIDYSDCYLYLKEQ